MMARWGRLVCGRGVKKASNRGCFLLVSMRAVRGLKNCQMTCKPGSVTTAEAVDDGYSSRMAVANHLKQPTRTSVQDRTCCTRQRVSLRGLAPDGVYHARSVTSSAVRSYRTFSPLPANPFPASGGLFSVALSLGLPPPGVTRHPDPVEPGLSSPFEETKAAATQSSDRAKHTLPISAWSSKRLGQHLGDFGLGNRFGFLRGGQPGVFLFGFIGL